MPAAFCGIVGLKPTYGLVPYSGILGLQTEIDHCGPMTKTVRDNALLLQVIAGPDGMDDRQPRSIPASELSFSTSIDTFLSTASSKPLAGFRIGVLKEGFDSPVLNSNVDKAVRHAIETLGSLGAEITDISIPEHHGLGLTWGCGLTLGGARDALLGQRTGRKELHMTDRAPKPDATISQERFDDWGAGAQSLYLEHLLVQERYGHVVHAKATNLTRKYTRAYDAALASLDAIVMPTVPFPPTPSFREGEEAGPLARTMRGMGIVANTAPFDASGHPALSVPVGFVPAADNESIKLPTGLQIVGKHFDDLTCYKIGAAWEAAKDWKALTYGN